MIGLSHRIWIVGTAGAMALLVVVAVIWRGHISCGLFYPECNPFLAIPETPDWRLPVSPDEARAYEEAHSLRLPTPVKQPVRFDFAKARIAHGYGGKSVAQQYFEHLCATEAADYVFEAQSDVAGFRFLRPQAGSASSDNEDRYGVENPTGFGWMMDDNQLDTGGRKFESSYVQPTYGVYEYVEFADPERPATFIRVFRSSELAREPQHTEQGYALVTVPQITARQKGMQGIAQFGMTWRGLRRPRDREFGIAGGDYVVVRLSDKKVLGLRRTFRSTYFPSSAGRTDWRHARLCSTKIVPVPYFVSSVIKPPLEVNDEFLPESMRSEYHQYLAKRTDPKHDFH